MSCSHQPELCDYKKALKLGEGQLGGTWIYKAKQSRGVAFQPIGLPKQIAVKQLKTYSLNEEQRTAVEDIQCMEHKNILKYYKTEMIGDCYYIKMELVQSNLEELRRKNGGRFSVRDFKLLEKQIREGLGYIHSRNVVHGRLHPRNILVTCEHGDYSQCCTIKLSDYGLGLNSEFRDVNLYTAPERIGRDNSNSIGACKSADVFSAGVVFFEMLTRKVPFTLVQLREAQTSQDVWRKSLEQLTCSFNYFFAALFHSNWQQRFSYWSRTLEEWIEFESERPMATLVDIEHNIGGMTALWKAAIDGSYDLAKWLIDSGDDVNRKYANDKTALHWACRTGHLSVARLFIERGADVNGADKYGQTSLNNACLNGYLPVVQLLIESGADVNRANNNGFTPLYNAQMKRHHKIVQFISQHEA